MSEAISHNDAEWLSGESWKVTDKGSWITYQFPESTTITCWRIRPLQMDKRQLRRFRRTWGRKVAEEYPPR